MKVLYKEKIGNHTVVRLVNEATVCNEKTKAKVKSLLKPKMTDKEIENLYMNNLVYADFGVNTELVNDSIGEEFQKKLNEAVKNQLLLDNGEYIADFRDVEYWIKRSGKWCMEVNENKELGVMLSKGAVLRSDLTEDQQKEISAQQETERIASLSAEEKAKEKHAALDSLADEADRLDRRSKIQRTVFDPVAWYNENANLVVLKYA